MKLLINFGFKPLDSRKLLQQYKRVNSKIDTPIARERATILQSMTDNPIDPSILSHTITDDKGIKRQVITGLSTIKDISNTPDFPSKKVGLLASSPIKSKLRKQSTTEDLSDYLLKNIGIDGTFEIDPSNRQVRNLYENKLGIDGSGLGTGRSLKNIIRNRRGNS